MERSRRVAVSSPQTRLAHARGRARGRWRVARLDPGDAERAEALYRRQRAQAGVALLLVAVLVSGLPLLLWARPGLDDLRLLDVPVSWLMIGVLPYPAMAALGFWQLLRAERIERAPGGPDAPADRPPGGSAGPAARLPGGPPGRPSGEAADRPGGDPECGPDRPAGQDSGGPARRPDPGEDR
ncbi:hypothetical protein [Nocardiopsis sp. CNT-189]|uniref:hypothetical protein n=1 Tax=Nocardiopsis oceanisediminis TaxID=2816862 RepID=UPI003B3BAAEE